MVAKKKKLPEKNDAGTPGSGRILRGNAEEQLAHSPKNTSDLKGQFPEALIHELRVHQVELETQAEELRKSKIALEESRDKYLDLYDFAPIGYLTLNDKALITEVNLTGATLLGIERSKLVNARFRKFIAEKDSELWILYFMQVSNQDNKQTCTLTLKRGDDSLFPARLESIRLTDSDGAITVRVAIGDITDRKQAEKALLQEQQFSKSVLDSLPGIFYLYTYPECQLILWNRQHETIFGFTPEEMKGRHVTSWHGPESKEAVMQAVETVMKTGQGSMDATLITKDGRPVPFFLTGSKFEAHCQSYLMGIGIDITERKRAEEALRESDARQRAMIANITDVIAIIDTQGIIRYKSENIEKIFGWKPEELVGLSFRETAHPEDVEQITNVFLKLIEEENASTTVEYRYKLKDGSFHTIHLTAKNLIQDPTINGVLVNYHDITDRKFAEDTLLKVNQKLNVLSQLTRKDLTNQIFVLNSYLELTKNQLAGQDRIIETLQKGVREIRLIQETIEYSKDYQDMGAKPPKWQNVKMTMLLGISHISIGNVQHSLETENLEIFADPLLEKVCQRLFENSVKHGDHVTRIRVWHTANPDGATIFFEDDGIGISADKKEKIFLRDVSTGRASMRSLIFVREILDITGITIKETGEPGKGARFEMRVTKGAWK